MAELNQYLRIGLWGTDYLLPSAASYSIEQRENLVANDVPSNNIVAWRQEQPQPWPAFYLDANLRPVVSGDWQRAVFLEAAPYPVGLIADEFQLLARADVHVEALVPLGPAPSRAGHLFSGVWIHDNKMILVLYPQGLVGYLQKLGNIQ